MTDAMTQQHRQELLQVRAQLYELKHREHELVMILSTLAAVHKAEVQPPDTPPP